MFLRMVKETSKHKKWSKGSQESKGSDDEVLQIRIYNLLKVEEASVEIKASSRLILPTTIIN